MSACEIDIAGTVACSEADPRVDPARFINLTASGTQVIKTAGGRTEGTVNTIYYADQANRIGMIVIMQHTSTFPTVLTRDGRTEDAIDCAWSPGDVEANVRSDIQALKASPYVRKDIPIIGYVLDVVTAQLREVRYVQPPTPTSEFIHHPAKPAISTTRALRVPIAFKMKMQGVGKPLQAVEAEYRQLLGTECG